MYLYAPVHTHMHIFCIHIHLLHCLNRSFCSGASGGSGSHRLVGLGTLMRETGADIKHIKGLPEGLGRVRQVVSALSWSCLNVNLISDLLAKLAGAFDRSMLCPWVKL